MNYSKPTIYTALCFLGVITLSVIAYYFSKQGNIASGNIAAPLSNIYVFSYTALITLYILIIFPLWARHIGKKLTNKKWIRDNLIFSTILLLVIYFLLESNQNKNISILIINLTTLSLIFLAGQVWIFSYKLANNHTSILRFIRNNFNEFEIEKEFPSQNRNKLFLLHKENQRYILKIHRKSKRHSNTEVLVMSNLESQIQTPKLISYNVKSPPRYILMTYCGSRILESDNEKYYYDSGKLIAQISQISLTKSNLKTIKKKKINKIQSFIENTQSHHPYLEYLKLYTKLSSNYFSHGDFSLDQVMVNNEDSITIIDWETACFNYRLADLANALSHSLVIKVSTSHAQAIFAGYTSINTLSDNHEIKFLLGLIWSNLFRSKGNEISLQNPKRLAYLENLVKDRSLEKIFKLDL